MATFFQTFLLIEKKVLNPSLRKMRVYFYILQKKQKILFKPQRFQKNLLKYIVIADQVSRF